MTLDELEVGKVSPDADDGLVVHLVHSVNVVEPGQRSVRDQLVGGDYDTVGELQAHYGRSGGDRSAASRPQLVNDLPVWG